MLAVSLAGESPAGGTCPVAAVVIPDGDEGDRIVESSGVNVSVGRGIEQWASKGNPLSTTRSDPSGRQTNRQAVARVNRFSLEMIAPLETDGGGFGSAEPFNNGRRLAPVLCVTTSCTLRRDSS